LGGREVGMIDYGTSISATNKRAPTLFYNKIEPKAITPHIFMPVCIVLQNLHYNKQPKKDI